MSEHTFLGIRYIPHVPEVMLVAAWCGIGVGLTALSLFLLTLSYSVGFGFILGVFFLSIIGEFIKYQPDEPGKNNKKKNPGDDA